MVNRIFAEELLSFEGHTVVSAKNGQEALEQLKMATFDVVLMDIGMPEMDGIEACRRIREGEAGNPQIPIIALTAHALKGDREWLLGTGMNDYLAKPIDSEGLERVLANIVAEAKSHGKLITFRGPNGHP